MTVKKYMTVENVTAQRGSKRLSISVRSAEAFPGS